MKKKKQFQSKAFLYATNSVYVCNKILLALYQWILIVRERDYGSKINEIKIVFDET